MSEQEIGGKMKDTVKAALITGVLGVVASIVTGVFTYKAGAENVEQRIDNQISQVVEVDNGDVDAAVEYLISRIEELEEENDTLEKENASLNVKIENSNDVKTGQTETQTVNNQSVNLLETDYLNQSKGSTFKGIVDVEGDKDNVGTIHSKGFVYDGDSYYMGYRTYALNSKYESVSGVIAIPFDSRDTEGKCTVRITDENDNQLYQSQEITGGVQPQEFEVDVSGVEELTFEFITTEGSIQVGVYDVKVHN